MNQADTIPDQRERDFALVCDARDKQSRRAYSVLVSTYREPLYLLMLRMTRNPNDADDLTQETFSKAFCQLNRYSPTNTFSAWLFTIGINTCIDFIRRRKLETVPLSNIAHSSEEGRIYEFPIPSDAPTPEESIISSQRAEALRKAVRRLSPSYQTIVEMRYFNEMSYEQIAQQLELPLGTVKVRLMRARKQIALLIQNHNEEI